MSKFTVTLKTRTGATNGVEGVYQLPNSSPAKLARKDGTTVFPNRGSLVQAAKRLASSISWDYEIVETQKKAAKKSVKPVAVKSKTAMNTPAKTKVAPTVSAASSTKSTSCTKNS